MATAPLDELVRGAKLLCLDAGNTIIFLDHPRLARWATDRGVTIDAATLVRTEGAAKLSQEDPLEHGPMFDPEWHGRDLPGARGWGRMTGTMLHRAGVPPETVASWLPDLWQEHMRWNLWSLVPDGLGASLDEARDRGMKVAVVSNSEGKLDELFTALGIRGHIDLLLDSGIVGVEKPDPRIFWMATEAYGVAPSEAIHLGDSIATDVKGARAAGIRVALIDPYGHAEGRALDVPRVPGVTDVARAMAASIATK